jgi:DNA repair photolyase
MKSIVRKSLLYKSEVEYADYCLNHVEGCSHGCKYPCYAYMMKKRCGIVKTYEEWCQPKIVSNAMELLETEIPKHRSKIKRVHLCFSTDPFMYEQPQVEALSLRIIERLNKNHIKCTVLTKGVYPEDLIDKDKYSSTNEYGITLVSSDEGFRSEYEPNAAKFKARIRALKMLHDNGAKTWVSMEPYPTPNIVSQDLNKLLEAISFVDKIVFGRLNYNVKSSQWANHKEYYNECVNSVVKFCKKNAINSHIKSGTKT